MTTPTHPHTERRSNPTTTGRHARGERTAPSHARTTTVLRLAGQQLPQVRTHPGTVTPESPDTSYGVRSLTVTLGHGTLIYCMNRNTVDKIAGAFDRACEGINALPEVTTRNMLAALHPDSDAGTQTTTAITFHEAPTLVHKVMPGRNGTPEIALFLGPLTVIVNDRTALADVRSAWTYARDAARRHWARERVRSDWDHIT